MALRAKRQLQKRWKPIPNSPQQQAFHCEAFEILYGGGLGGGKGLAVDTPIPTPSGWKTMGELQVGDELFDQDGKPCCVTAVSGINYRPCFRLIFDDGSEIIADDVHRWVTFNKKELLRLTRSSPEWRAKRRANRPSRAESRKSDKFREMISARNSARGFAHISVIPKGTIRNTAEIAMTLRTRNGNTNHAIKVGGALSTNEIKLPIPPYTLGAWLGDGTRRNGQLTSIDPDVWKHIEADGFEVRHYDYRDPDQHNIIGLKVLLRKIGVLNNKHIPLMYMRAGILQRLELLRGLMDTDGHASIDGGAEFDNINEKLALDVFELVRSLGIKATIQRGLAKLDGRVICPKWRIKFTSNIPVFSLSRKAERIKSKVRRVSQFRYIIDCQPVSIVPTRCIAVDSPTHQYLASRAMIPTHNTDLLIGKSTHNHKRSLLLRRTFPEVARTLVFRSHELFDNLGKYNDAKHIWQLDGKTIEFGHVENAGSSFELPGDAKNYAGSAYDYIGFDQLEDFPEHVYEYIITRARTASQGIKTQIVSTANPIGEHIDWIMKRWAAWLDETYVRPAKPGEIRYFKRGTDNMEIETSADDIDAVSRTFIPAKLKDNPYYGEDYRRNINLIREPMRSALLDGNWKAMLRDDAYQVIPRAWVKAAMERWRNRKRPEISITAVGADASRGGNCKTVLAERRLNWYAPLRKYQGEEVKDGQAFLNLLRDIPIGDAPVNIDVIGIGASPYDFAKEKYNAVPINVSEAPDKDEYGKPATDRSGKFQFFNKRTQYVWQFAEALDPDHGEDFALPDDPELLGDLCSYRYKISGGKIKLEDKEETTKRLGRSPDCSEAVILANAKERDKTFSVSTAYDESSEQEVLNSIGLRAWH